MSDQETSLTLEQQFQLRSFEDQVNLMSREQCQRLLLELYRQMMAREAMYKKLIGYEWGIEPRPPIE